MLTIWAFIPLVALCANVAMLAYALYVDSRNPANRALAMVCGTLAWWAVFNLLMHVATDPATANLAIRFAAPAWVLVAPMVLHFVLVVVRDRPFVPDHPAFLLTYAAGVPFILLRWFTELIYTDTPALRAWGYQQVPGRLFPLFGAYTLVLTVIALLVALRYTVRATNDAERRRMLCLTCGLAIPIIGAIVTNIALPMLGIRTYYSALGLTTFTTGFFAVGIVRYRMFHPTLMRSARQVLQHMSQPVLLVALDGCVQEANDAAQTVALQRAEDVNGAPVANFFAGGAAGWDALLQERDADGQVTNREMDWVTADGTAVPMLVSLTTLLGADGRTEGYLLLGTDYRELQQTQAALADSEALYRTLYESSVQGVVLAGETFYQVNHEAARILGCPAQELIGRRAEDFWPETQADGRPSAVVAEENIRAVLAGRPQFFPWRVRRPDGTCLDCEMSMNAVTIRGERLWQFTFRDVTEQRRLEEAIQHLHQATANVVGTDFFTTLVHHLAEWLGMSWAQIVELTPEDPHTAHALAVSHDGQPGDLLTYALEGTPCQDVVDRGFQCVPDDVAARYPQDAMLVDARIRSYVGLPLTDPEGRVIGLMCAFHEEPLTLPARLVEALFSVFGARAGAELLRLRAEAQEREHAERLRELQKNESIALLAGGVAHDFNNILVGVLGHASLAREELPPDSPAHRSLQVIEESAERAVGLTTQLLAYARGGKENPEAIDLRSVIVELLDMLEVVLPKAVKVQCVLPDHFPTVLADSSQLQQVVMNLCTNAGEAMGDAGGTLTVTLAMEDGPLHCAEPGDTRRVRQLVLTVADTGCGMDAATRDHIFEPFYSTKEFGRGLGLSAALGIVLNHGGCLHCDSALGQGTTFRIYLPAHVAPTPAPAPCDVTSPTPHGHETILLVDDEELVSQFAQDALTRLGYHVLAAADGDEALAVYREHGDEIDLVLMDMIMPGRNGLDTLAALRELNPAVKTILSSGYGLEELPGSHQGPQPTAFLKKPYRTRKLAETVRAALSASSAGA